MAREYQTVFIRPTAAPNGVAGVNLDLVQAPVDKIQHRSIIGCVLIAFLRDAVKLVWNFERTNVSGVGGV